MIENGFGKIDLEVIYQDKDKNFVIMRQSTYFRSTWTEVGKRESKPSSRRRKKGFRISWFIWG